MFTFSSFGTIDIAGLDAVAAQEPTPSLRLVAGSPYCTSRMLNRASARVNSRITTTLCAGCDSRLREFAHLSCNGALRWKAICF